MFVPGFPGFEAGGYGRKIIVLGAIDMIDPDGWCKSFDLKEDEKL
jgi:hypothetical protein